MLERLHQSDEALIGKKVLVVDDDVRNIFALTSLLEQHGMQVVSAETGTEAISLLDHDDDAGIELLLGVIDVGQARAARSIYGPRTSRTEK